MIITFIRFNPNTTFCFNLPATAKVDLSIYNIKGQKVKTLVASTLLKGQHKIEWKGKDNNDRAVGSGVYFYKLQVSGHKSIIKKCVMLK